MEILTNLGQLMREKGVVDADIERECGITRMTVCNARRGRNVTLKVAQAIAKVLGEPLEKIWPKEEEEAA